MQRSSLQWRDIAERDDLVEVIDAVDDGRVENVGMPSNDFLHLAGIDMLPAGDYHVVLAINDLVEAVLVHAGQVGMVEVPARCRAEEVTQRTPDSRIGLPVEYRCRDGSRTVWRPA